METRLGMIAALVTSVSWTATALFFEYAANRIGSLALNVLRLLAALALFAVLGLVLRGEAVPLGAGLDAWTWLGLSGLVGFVFGDLFLFQAYVDIGARKTQVVFSAAPLLTALIGFLVLGERVAPLGLAGMAVVVAGIALVVMGRSGDADDPARRVPAARSLRGVAWAFLGALGQAGGLVLSKMGAVGIDPFAATEIRVIAGLAGFLVVAAVWGRFAEPWKALSDRAALAPLAAGAFFGPFLGVSLGLFAVQRVESGVAATLMGLTPVLILLPSAFLKKERIRPREILGAALAVAGSSILVLAG